MTENEPVWREEIEKEVEYLGEGSRSVAQFYHRAQSQGAPAELLQVLGETYQNLEAARQRLQSVTTCFHPEPRQYR